VLRRLLLPLLLALALPWAAHGQQWSTYKPAGAGYSIDLPGKPTIESETSESAAGPVKNYIASVEVGETGYVSMYTVYPMGTDTDADEVLDAARDGMLEDGKSELRDEKRLTIGNLPARRVALYDTESNLVIVNLMLYRGNTLYQSIYAAPPSQQDTDSSRRFFASFKLIGR
jgi:hypothetical protein